jgi:sterol 24-C-methyltransferase
LKLLSSPPFNSAFNFGVATKMAPAKLETENHSRDAAFNKAMHKDSAAAQGGFSAMLRKDKAAQKAAVDEYFKHWDNKAAVNETAEDREVCLGYWHRS